MNNYRLNYRSKFLLPGILFLTVSLILFAATRDQLGDVNNDGEVNILDIVRIVNIILDIDPPPTDYELWASDVNVDDSTDVVDIIIIVQLIIGNDDCPDLYSPCSDNLTLCCADTTSHLYEYETDVLGISFSTINDVAIVDENNIWAVGEIHTEETDQFDSTGTWIQPYNAAKWDGEEWVLERVIQPGGYVQAIRCLDYVSENDIWFGKGSLPIHWDGTEYYLFTPAEDDYPGGNIISEIYHNSPDDIFIIGHNGSIIHYDGSSFEQMESGTEVDLIDISGTSDGEHIFAVGLTNSEWWGNLILEFSEGSWSTLYESDHYLPDTGDYGAVLNVSVHADTAYIMTMGGLWKYNYLDQGSDFVSENNYNEGNYYHNKHITVLGFNDIFTVSSRWNTAHYNGETWYYDNDVNHNFGNGNVWVKSADYKSDMFVIVGYINNPQTALIMRGSRY